MLIILYQNPQHFFLATGSSLSMWPVLRGTGLDLCVEYSSD